MIKNDLKPISSVLNDLRSQGYTTDFRLAKNKLIPFQYPTRAYTADTIAIVDTYRFEGDTDPGDASIMYVIETNDGLKGTITNGYNAEADTAVDEFLAHVKDRAI